MKTLLSAALLVAATSVAANAADMSMPYKAAPVAQSVYNWTGFYLGGTAGGGIANSDHADIDDFFGGGAKFQQAFGTVGLTAGYNWQFGHTVLGIEGDYNWASVDNTKGFDQRFADDADSSTSRFRMNEFATLRARGGLAFERTLIYATAGVAFAHIHNTTQFNEEGTPFSASENKWKTGLAVGAGVEFALTQNWTLKGEYMLMQFQSSTADILNTDGTQVCSPQNCRMGYNESVQLARIGVNYKFGY